VEKEEKTARRKTEDRLGHQPKHGAKKTGVLGLGFILNQHEWRKKQNKKTKQTWDPTLVKHKKIWATSASWHHLNDRTSGWSPHRDTQERKKEKQKHIQARGEEHDLARQRQDQQSTEIISRPVAQQWRRKQRYPAWAGSNREVG
jgi:hypothetical protein